MTGRSHTGALRMAAALTAAGRGAARCNVWNTIHARGVCLTSFSGGEMRGVATILIVDDEPGIVESLQKIFEREELTVLTAPRGEDALTVLQAQPIDVVLTDLRMARLSGLDLLRTIRSEYPETEVLLMTAY